MPKAKIKFVSEDRFNRMVLTEKAPKGNSGHPQWCYICDCGNQGIVAQRSLSDPKHPQQSCGCFQREQFIERQTKHGGYGTPEYTSWNSMKDRCRNSNNKKFCSYGGRGITVCKRWMDSFENFLGDIGNKPSPAHSIDRIDVNGNYEPVNCRWATKKEQSRNRRNNRYEVFRGESRLLVELCEEVNIKYDLVLRRIDALNWTLENALTVPSMKRNGNNQHFKNGIAISKLENSIKSEYGDISDGK